MEDQRRLENQSGTVRVSSLRSVIWITVLLLQHSKAHSLFTQHNIAADSCFGLLQNINYERATLNVVEKRQQPGEQVIANTNSRPRYKLSSAQNLFVCKVLRVFIHAKTGAPITLKFFFSVPEKGIGYL